MTADSCGMFDRTVIGTCGCKELLVCSAEGCTTLPLLQL